MINLVFLCMFGLVKVIRGDASKGTLVAIQFWRWSHEVQPLDYIGLDPASSMREYSVLFCLVCGRVRVRKFGKPGIVAVEAFGRRSGG
jgi:hypothetical protein